MKNYYIILGIILLTIFSVNVSAGKTNGQNCTNNSECNSNFCAQGFCCNINECGYNSICYNLNGTYNSPGTMGGVDHVCTQAGWKLALTENCNDDSLCLTNKCTNNYCCNANQCGGAYMSPGFCFDVGENFCAGQSGCKKCVSEGILKTLENSSCSNNSECMSNNCVSNKCATTTTTTTTTSTTTTTTPLYPYKSNCTQSTQCASNYCINGVCCNQSQCGIKEFDKCYNLNGTYTEAHANHFTFVCTQNGWKKAQGQLCTANTECVSNNCISNVCCGSNQCAHDKACYNPNETYTEPHGNHFTFACTLSGWKKTKGDYCLNAAECLSGKCINNYCCGSGQCGAIGDCVNIGGTIETVVSPQKFETCVSEGVWKLANNQSCSNNSVCASNKCVGGKCAAPNNTYHHLCNTSFECASGYCNGGYCCNSGECGTYYRCVLNGVTTNEGSGPTHTCRNGTWKDSWGTGCGNYGCDFGTTCIGGFCCSPGQCSYDYMLNNNCFNVGDVVHDTITCTTGGIWKTKYGSACSNNSECLTGNCNNGMCCNSGECGNDKGCSKEGEGPPYSNPGTHVCHNGKWMSKFGASCGSTSDCAAGICIPNGFCCNPNQCGISRSASNNCFDIGQTDWGHQICVSEGTWKTINKYACTNNSECVSGSCNNGLCCNTGECSRNGLCYASGNMSSTEVCRSGTWKRPYGSACDQYGCDNTTCINGFCCKNNQCGYSTNLSNNCYGLGTIKNNLKCIEQGNWSYIPTTSTTTTTTTSTTTTTLPTNQTGGIQVQAFRDLDTDSAQDGNEPGIAGVTFNVVGPQSFTLVTGSNGAAKLEHLPFGNYTITEIMPPGYTNTTPTNANADVSYWAIFVFSFGHKQTTTTTTTTSITTSTTSTTTTSTTTTTIGCVGEGSNIIIVPNSPQCCAGLTPINPRGPDANGTCGPPSAGASTCAYCGNGVCGLGENKCNCPSDCSTSGEYLWWFDNTTRVCGLKEFTGAYMYYGLQTFKNESDCLKELTGIGCVGEGSNIIIVPNSPRCCSGLTAISPDKPNASGECSPHPITGASKCAYCGNGVCGLGENKCNCPSDCTTTTTTTSTTTTTIQEGCIRGVSVSANWNGSRTTPPTMQVWVDGRLGAEWSVLKMTRDYSYETDFSCGEHKIDIVYKNSSAAGNGTFFVYNVKVDCNKLDPRSPDALYDKAVNSGFFDGQELTSGRVELIWPGTLRFTFNKNCGNNTCSLIGDNPPCGQISMSELTNLIDKWVKGQAKIGDVINLITTWKYN